MKVDNFVFNRLMYYIQYISTTARPPKVIIPGYNSSKKEEEKDQAISKYDKQKKLETVKAVEIVTKNSKADIIARKL